MSTRSVVAELQGDGWRGRYVHSDGYESHMIPALRAIYAAHDGDVERVTQRLLHDRYGWSSLNPDQPDTKGVKISPSATYGTYEYGTPEYTKWNLTSEKGGYSDGRFANEPGLGIAYTTKNGQSAEDQWITSDGNDTWGTEYAYVLSRSGIVCLEATYEGGKEGWKQREVYDWAPVKVDA